MTLSGHQRYGHPDALPPGDLGSCDWLPHGRRRHGGADRGGSRRTRPDQLGRRPGKRKDHLDTRVGAVRAIRGSGRRVARSRRAGITSATDPEVSFPFTSMRPLAPPGSPTMSFPIRPIRGTLSGHASGALTDGTTGGCSSNLSSLPNNFGESATLNMATIDKRHLALWTTAEDPTDLLITEPCATQLGNLGEFPNAQPDQKRKPDVHETPISMLRDRRQRTRQSRQACEPQPQGRVQSRRHDGRRPPPRRRHRDDDGHGQTQTDQLTTRSGPAQRAQT